MNNQNKVKKIGFGGLLFSLITYGYVAWDDLKGKYLLNESDYIQVHGKVVYSAVIEKEDKYEKINYYPTVKYEFYAKGKLYRSDQVHFNYTAHHSSESAEKVLNKYPINKSITVFYEHDNPNFSVLEPNNYEKGDEVVVFLCMVWGLTIIFLYNWNENRKSRRHKYS